MRLAGLCSRGEVLPCSWACLSPKSINRGKQQLYDSSHLPRALRYLCPTPRDTGTN